MFTEEVSALVLYVNIQTEDNSLFGTLTLGHWNMLTKY